MSSLIGSTVMLGEGTSPLKYSSTYTMTDYMMGSHCTCVCVCVCVCVRACVCVCACMCVCMHAIDVQWSLGTIYLYIVRHSIDLSHKPLQISCPLPIWFFVKPENSIIFVN